MYCIKYDYITGDSFHTEERTKYLEFKFEKLETAQAALKRIQEHYEYYTAVRSSGRWSPREPVPPEWHKELDTKDYDKSTLENFIVIRGDNGEKIQFWPDWCGYFESLQCAYISVKEEYGSYRP